MRSATLFWVTGYTPCRIGGHMSEGPVNVAFFEFIHENTRVEVREAFQ